jgi:hypothetical protein
MNIAELINSIKRYAKFIVIGVLIIVSLFTVNYFFDNPAGDQRFGKLERPKFDSVLSSEIKLKASNVARNELPKLVEVYESSGFLDPSEMAKKLDLPSQTKSLGTSTVWEQQPKRLKVSNERGDFTFNSDTNIGGKTTDVKVARSIAEEFVKKLGLLGEGSELREVSVGYVNLQPPEFEIVEEEKPFNVYSFSFGVKIGEVDIINETGSDVIYNIWIGVDGTVKKATGSLQIFKKGQESTYPVKKFSQVITELSENKVTVVNITKQLATRISYPVIFDTIKIVYLANKKSEKYLQPTILMVGSSVAERGRVFALTTGLKDEVYQK